MHPSPCESVHIERPPALTNNLFEVHRLPSIALPKAGLLLVEDEFDWIEFAGSLRGHNHVEFQDFGQLEARV